MKLTLLIAMSLDGCIAREDDSTPWSKTVWAEYASFVQAKGNLIVGRKTFDIMRAEHELERIGRPFTVVLSETRTGSPDARTMFVKTPDEALAVMKGQGYMNVILGGGTRVNTTFLNLGLIDEIVLDIEPTLLHSGKHLFDPSAKMPKLRLLDTTALDQTVTRVHYAVMRHRT